MTISAPETRSAKKHAVIIQWLTRTRTEWRESFVATRTIGLLGTEAFSGKCADPNVDIASSCWPRFTPLNYIWGATIIN